MIQIWKNRRLPWQHQVPDTTTCHTKLFPNKILDVVAKFGSVWLNIEKVINVESQCGNSPHPPPVSIGLKTPRFQNQRSR